MTEAATPMTPEARELYDLLLKVDAGPEVRDALERIIEYERLLRSEAYRLHLEEEDALRTRVAELEAAIDTLEVFGWFCEDHGLIIAAEACHCPEDDIITLYYKDGD